MELLARQIHSWQLNTAPTAKELAARVITLGVDPASIRVLAWNHAPPAETGEGKAVEFAGGRYETWIDYEVASYGEYGTERVEVKLGELAGYVNIPRHTQGGISYNRIRKGHLQLERTGYEDLDHMKKVTALMRGLGFRAWREYFWLTLALDILAFVELARDWQYELQSFTQHKLEFAIRYHRRRDRDQQTYTCKLSIEKLENYNGAYKRLTTAEITIRPRRSLFTPPDYNKVFGSKSVPISLIDNREVPHQKMLITV